MFKTSMIQQLKTICNLENMRPDIICGIDQVLLRVNLESHETPVLPQKSL
jgi:hypothetical protein